MYMYTYIYIYMYVCIYTYIRLDAQIVEVHELGLARVDSHTIHILTCQSCGKHSSFFGSGHTKMLVAETD